MTLFEPPVPPSLSNVTVYAISFDIKAAVPGEIQVYQQNGSGFKYHFVTFVEVTTSYKRIYVTVTPTLYDSSVSESWLAFYGSYGTGRIVSVKNVKIELGTSGTPWAENGIIPSKTGYIFKEYYSGPNGFGVQYIDANGCSNQTWDVAQNTTLYAYWQARVFPVEVYFSGEGLNYWKTVRDATFDEAFFLTAETLEGYNYLGTDFNSGVIPNHAYLYSSKSETVTYQYYMIYNMFTDTYYLPIYWYYEKDPNCVAEGTLITLADGSQKAVEDLNGNESLLVWNLFTGQFDTAPILFIDSDPEKIFEVINLYFSDGTTVKVISEHGFWNIDLNQYVYLRNDASQYIGHFFNKQSYDADGSLTWTAVPLTEVVVADEVTTAWSPVTYGHLCYYVNGMLSMPGATEKIVNIFEVDATTMQYNTAALNEDIATYGLFTYEEFIQAFTLPEAIFEAFGVQYFKVAMGKGLINADELHALIDRYSAFFGME